MTKPTITQADIERANAFEASLRGKVLMTDRKMVSQKLAETLHDHREAAVAELRKEHAIYRFKCLVSDLEDFKADHPAAFEVFLSSPEVARLRAALSQKETSHGD